MNGVHEKIYDNTIVILFIIILSDSNFMSVETILRNELVVIILNASKLLFAFTIIFIMSEFILFILINYFILGTISLEIGQFCLILINYFS